MSEPAHPRRRGLGDVSPPRTAKTGLLNVRDGSKFAGRPLTEKQAKICELRAEGKSVREVAGLMGVSEQRVRRQMEQASLKLGVRKVDAREDSVTWPKLGGKEDLKAEVEAAALEAASDPTRTQLAAIELVNAQLVASGVPMKVSLALLKRMKAKYGGVVHVRRQLRTSELVRVIDEEIDLVSQYIDDKVCAEAPLRDLALTKAALIEKRALLRGEPTAIVSDLERKRLVDLLPAFIAEARRRGVTVDGQVVAKIVEAA